MNPATVSLEKAKMLHDFGVNRISMGVQSWDPEMLNRLGRVHSAPQAERSFHLLREAGFTNVNLDLIFGIPGQSVETWEQSLSKTIGLAPGAYFCILPDLRGGHRIFPASSTGQIASRHGTRRKILRANDVASQRAAGTASTKSPTTRGQVMNVCTISLTGWGGTTSVWVQALFPRSEKDVGRIPLTPAGTSNNSKRVLNQLVLRRKLPGKSGMRKQSRSVCGPRLASRNRR